MLGYWFVSKEKTKDKLIITISLRIRIVFTVISLLLLVFNLYFLCETDYSSLLPLILPFIFLIISILAIFYNDSWIFDKNRQVTENRYGLLFLYRKKQIPLLDLNKVQLQIIKKSKTGNKTKKWAFGDLIILMLYNQQGDSWQIDMTKAVYYNKIKNIAQNIANFCKIPYEEEQQ